MYATTTDRIAAKNSLFSHGPVNAPGWLTVMLKSSEILETSSPLRMAFRNAVYPSSSKRFTILSPLLAVAISSVQLTCNSRISLTSFFFYEKLALPDKYLGRSRKQVGCSHQYQHRGWKSCQHHIQHRIP